MKKNKSSKYVSEYIVQEIKKINKEKMQILDVGCGTGEYIPFFKGYVTGIDFDTALINSAKQKFPKSSFIRHDCTKLPLPIKNKFNLIFSTELIEHLKRRDAVRLIKELEKKSNGYILISTPNVNNFTTLLRFILFRTVAIAGEPNTAEKILFFLKNRRTAPKINKYPVVDESLLADNPHKELHYHISSFNTSFFTRNNYKVVGGLGFISQNAIKNKYLSKVLNKLFYYFPYFAGDILAIKKVGN